MKRLFVIGLLCAACSSVSVAATPTTTPADRTSAPATEAPEATPAADNLAEAPTAAPVTDNLFAAGDVVTVTEDDEPWAEITVDKVKQRTKYAGEYLDDEPGAGNVYIEMFVTYKALVENVDYNPFDWQIFVDDVAIDDYTFVLNGPEPNLGSGSLPMGRRAQGWLVYEIPKTGRAVLSYGSNMFGDEPPVFEVVLRSK